MGHPTPFYLPFTEQEESQCYSPPRESVCGRDRVERKHNETRTMTLPGQLLMIATGLLCSSALAAAEHEAPVMMLRLKDGSTLTAMVDSKHVRLATPYGKVTVPSAMLSALKIDPDREGVKIEMSNGDRLSGSMAGTSLRISNALGRLGVPWAEVEELSASADGATAMQIRPSPMATTPIRFEVSLRDGSVVLGSPKTQSVTLHSVFGAGALPLVLVRNVKFHDNGDTCAVKFWNGDSIVGWIDWNACPLATGLGPTRINAMATSGIDVSLGGIDLVAKPHAAVSGNRYFLGAVKSSQPRRIGGRLLPASQFIEAHASGRIEYEFDTPISEFRAIAAMYESYAAHKGRVIFRVETEHGEIYSTRPIRNLQREEIYARFAPAKKLVLITDQNGSADEDWSVWLRPEVR